MKKSPRRAIKAPVGAAFSLGENKVPVKYHIPPVEACPILG